MVIILPQDFSPKFLFTNASLTFRGGIVVALSPFFSSFDPMVRALAGELVVVHHFSFLSIVVQKNFPPEWCHATLPPRIFVSEFLSSPVVSPPSFFFRASTFYKARDLAPFLKDFGV